ncbi:MAG: hypothetical protein R3F59_24520 [Myxococcota bacterium]
MDDELSRRDALRVGGLVAATSGLAAAGAGLPRLGRAAPHTAAHPVPYDLVDAERIVATTCAGCGGGCPVRAVRAGDVVGKVDGNPYSPRQGGVRPTDARHAARLRGTSCARGQSRPNVVHDPWRLLRPMVAEGPMRFRTVEDAQAVLPPIVEALAPSRGAPPDAPPGLVIAVDPRQQDRRPLLDAFVAAFPGARAILGHPAPVLAAASARRLGPGWLAAPRWERATLAVAWGADPVATGLDPVGSARGLAGRRDALVAIDPRLSATAGLAGSWIPVRPGGDAALALWIAALWDAAGWLPAGAVPEHARVRSDRDWEALTGVGRDLVARLAERMHAAGPGLAVAVGGSLDPDAADAVLALCDQVGALGPDGAMAPAADPIPAVDGARALRDAVCGGAPPAVLVVVGDGGLQDSPWLDEVLQALRGGAGHVVALGLAPGPLLAVADAFLPDTTELERFGLVRRHDGSSVVLPAVPAPAAGLEALLDALAGAPVAEPSFVAALEAAAAGLPPLSEADDAVLSAAVAQPALSPSGRALALRGWRAARAEPGVRARGSCTPSPEPGGRPAGAVTRGAPARAMDIGNGVRPCEAGRTAVQAGIPTWCTAVVARVPVRSSTRRCGSRRRWRSSRTPSRSAAPPTPTRRPGARTVRLDNVAHVHPDTVPGAGHRLAAAVGGGGPWTCPPRSARTCAPA